MIVKLTNINVVNSRKVCVQVGSDRRVGDLATLQCPNDDQRHNEQALDGKSVRRERRCRKSDEHDQARREPKDAV